MTDKRIHAFQDDALGEHDATALAELVRQGKRSASELTEAVIARIEQVDGQLHAIAQEDFIRARQAAQGTQQGAFAGVPTLIKDNIDVAGLVTQNGTQACHPAPCKKDSGVTRQFRAQGFTLLGKSRLPEFGLNPSCEPAEGEPVRNPWHTDYSSGASSAGAAALVASGALPIAHANDGGGSIRIPAACCGLVGLKPSRARLVNSEASRSLPVNIVCEGVLSRSVRDTANFMAAAEQYHYNKRYPRTGKIEGPGKQRRRIGLLIDSITAEATDTTTRAVVENTAKQLEQLGHTVEPIAVPVDAQFIDDFLVYYGFLALSLQTAGKFMFSRDFDKQKLEPLTRGLARYTRKRLLKLPGAIHRLRRSHLATADVFAQYDAILSPVLSRTTPEIGYLDPTQPAEELIPKLVNYVSFTPANNAAGSPAISLPMGQDEQELPVGIQLAANHGAEGLLLELAFELEAAQPWRRIQG